MGGAWNMTIEYKDSKRIVGLSLTTTEVGATGDSNAAIDYATHKYISGLTAGETISSVTLDIYNASTNIKVGVYDSTGSGTSTSPNSLLAQGVAAVSVSNTYTTVTIPLTTTCTVPSNGIVWVGMFPEASVSFRQTTSSGTYTNSKHGSGVSGATYANAMPSTAWVSTGGDGGNGGYNVRFGVITNAKPTDVQDNSILVEKDTGKRYWFESELAPTFEDDTFSSNWTSTGSKVVTGTNVIDWDGIQDGSVNGISKDLQDSDALGSGNNASDTSWVLRATWTLSNLASPSSASNQLFIGLSDQNHSTSGTSNQDGIVFYVLNDASSASNLFRISYGDGSSLNSNSQDFAETVSTGTRYIELKRTATNEATCAIYSDATYETLVELETFTIPTSIIDLRYITVKMRSSSAVGGTFNGTIDDVEFYNAVTSVTPATWTYPPEGIDSSGQIAQLSGSNAANSYTAASEFYTISTDTWDSAFNLSGGGRARAGSAGSTEHAYLLGGQDGSSYYSTIDKVAWADETNTTISRSARAWGGAVQNAVSVCVGQSYYNAGYHTTINEYTYGTMAETSQGNTSSAHPFGGSFGNSTYGFVINGQNTGIERYTYSDKSKTSSGFAASPTTTNSGGHTGNSTTGISINNTAGSGNARYDSYNISADTWTTGSATSSTPYENGRASGSSTWNLWSTQTNTSSARSCEKYNYSSGALSSFTSVATNLDGGDQDAGASSINTGVNS